MVLEIGVFWQKNESEFEKEDEFDEEEGERLVGFSWWSALCEVRRVLERDAEQPICEFLRKMVCFCIRSYVKIGFFFREEKVGGV